MDFWWNTRTIEVQSRIRRLIDGADGTDGVKQASWRQKRGGVLMEPTQTVANIALEFVALAVPRFFEGYGVCKRPRRIEHHTQGSREHLVVDLSFELLDDVIVQKILTDHEACAHRRCDKKIHKSGLLKITDIAN